MSGTLYIVATPIGNLEDITLRAMRVLTEVDLVLAEDTRVTKKLMDSIAGRQMSLGRMPTLMSYHQHSSETRRLEILKMLMDGTNIALVTDAGTPGISDPGNELVSFLVSQIASLIVVPVPGPSAITTALSVSGFDASKFTFLGFWPKKKSGRIVKLIKEIKMNFVFYESPFRILKTLELLEKELGSDTKIVVGREITKLYETIYRGAVGEVRREMEKKEKVKGEIVVVVDLVSKNLTL